MILLISPKNVYATKRLVEEAGNLNVPIEVVEVSDLVDLNFKIDVTKYNVLFVRHPYLNTSPKYIPEIINLAKKFEAAGKRVVDTVIAKGELGEGKWEDYKKLQQAGLTIPSTKLLSHYSISTTHYPLVLKWIYGFKGRGVFLVQNIQDVNGVLEKIPAKELMAQEFIPGEFEYKVMTVGFKALPVVLKVKINLDTHKPDFSNFYVIPNESDESGNPLNHQKEIPPLPQMHLVGRDDTVKQVIRMAEQSSKLLGRELSKVDIIQKGNRFYILEVNRWPGLDSFELLTKYNVAGEFVKYLVSS